jgi:hypothetical protein
MTSLRCHADLVLQMDYLSFVLSEYMVEYWNLKSRKSLRTCDLRSGGAVARTKKGTALVRLPASLDFQSSRTMLPVLMDSHWHTLGVNNAVVEPARDVFKSKAHTDRADQSFVARLTAV